MRYLVLPLWAYFLKPKALFILLKNNTSRIYQSSHECVCRYEKVFGQNPPFIDVNADDWFASAVQARITQISLTVEQHDFVRSKISLVWKRVLLWFPWRIFPKPLSKTEKIPFADLSSSDAAIAKVCVQEKLISIEEVDQTAPTEKDPDPEEVFPNFEPRGTVTRAEMALMVYRAILLRNNVVPYCFHAFSPLEKSFQRSVFLRWERLEKKNLALLFEEDERVPLHLLDFLKRPMVLKERGDCSSIFTRNNRNSSNTASAIVRPNGSGFVLA